LGTFDKGIVFTGVNGIGAKGDGVIAMARALRFVRTKITLEREPNGIG